MSGTRPMAAVDAQMFWMSAKVPNDQFLLYAFDGSPPRLEAAVEELHRRAAASEDLQFQVRDDIAWRYPSWVRGGVDLEQFTVREVDGSDWAVCMDAVARLGRRQLDMHRMCWRVYVFPDVAGIPGVGGAGSVVVVQISHSLGDGGRSAALAGALLGRVRRVPAVEAPDRGCFAVRAASAAAEHRQLVRDAAAGLIPAVQSQPRPVLSINRAPSGRAALRTIAVHADRLPGPTVTTGTLVAIADALSGYLGARGEEVAELGAEVPVAVLQDASAHNNFRNVGVGLYPELDRIERARRVAAELAGHRRRGRHPAVQASAAAVAAVPAPLLRWGVRRFDASARLSTVTGNTVVSSVNRGPADLTFGGCPVILTAGFPALSPMMSLTHGVHGIGDRIAISIHADAGNVDVDEYTARLRSALDLSSWGF